MKLGAALGTGRIVNKITVYAGDGYLFDVFNGRLRLYFDATHTAYDAAELPVGRFVHVAGTYDGVAVKLYVDGALRATSAASGDIVTNALPLRIGADSEGKSSFPGMLDEIGIYGRALDAGEIAQLAGSTLGRCR